jgi:hypothetical protein
MRQLLKLAEFFRKEIRKVFGERIMILYSCPSHPCIWLNSVYDEDDAPAEWMERVLRCLEDDEVYRKMTNRNDQRLENCRDCLFHMFSFDGVLHREVWKLCSDFFARDNYTVQEVGNICVPASVDTPSVAVARPVTCLAAVDVDRWAGMAKALVDATGCDRIYDILTRSEIVKHDDPEHIVSIGLEINLERGMQAGLIEAEFSESLVQGLFRNNIMIHHKTPAEIIEMIVRRALFSLGFSRPVPATPEGYPADERWTGLPGAIQHNGGGASFLLFDGQDPAEISAQLAGFLHGGDLNPEGIFQQSLYKGTCWASAINISAEGIDLEACRPRLDFGRGYYTGDRLRLAVEKALEYNQPALCIYLIPGDDFNDPRVGNRAMRCLSLQNDRERWDRITRDCRAGNRAVRTEIDYYDCIDGPLVRNPGEERSEQIMFGETVPQQYCFRTEDSAEWLDQYLRLVVFLRQRTDDV